MSQYIGKTISLISNSNIRYLGILHEISSEQSTVSLKQVRSYGTEGRRLGVDEIPPSEGVYEFIVFRGSDVKDLKIAESASAPAPVPFQDPAIIQSQNQPQAQAPYPAQGSIPAPSEYAYPPKAGSQAPRAPATAPTGPAAHRAPATRAQEQPAAAIGSNGQSNEDSHHKHRPHQHPHPHIQKPEITSDFDFAGNTEKFSKQSIIPPVDDDDKEKFYNRSTSFFDNISSAAKDRAEGVADSKTGYERRGEERKLNLETFGQASAYRGRGRGRGGRGRGGRGGRGRGGRGGYYNNFNAPEQS